MTEEDKKVCTNCGHYKYLHNFRDECDACDSPEVPMNKKCIGFLETKT